MPESFLTVISSFISDDLLVGKVFPTFLFFLFLLVFLLFHFSLNTPLLEHKLTGKNKSRLCSLTNKNNNKLIPDRENQDYKDILT